MSTSSVEKENKAFFKIILGSSACWYLAGFFIASMSIKPIHQSSGAVYEKKTDSSTSKEIESKHINSTKMNFCIKNGLAWGLTGGFIALLMPSRARSAFYTAARTRANKPQVVVLTLFLFAMFMALTGGFVLSKFVLTSFNLPDNFIIEAGSKRIVLSCLISFLATIPNIPLVLKFIKQYGI